MSRQLQSWFFFIFLILALGVVGLASNELSAPGQPTATATAWQSVHIDVATPTPITPTGWWDEKPSPIPLNTPSPSMDK